MRKKGMTINDAAHEWVKEFNAFPYGMIEKLMKNDPNEWYEVTMPAYGDRVYVYEEGEYGEIENIREPSDDDDIEEILYEITLDKGNKVFCTRDDFESEYYGGLPMWGTLWQFGDSCDDWWLEEGDGIRIMSECGFRIYEHEEFGYFFGIDGAGYDFYEAHWIPLYKARGLHWHDEEAMQ